MSKLTAILSYEYFSHFVFMETMKISRSSIMKLFSLWMLNSTSDIVRNTVMTMAGGMVQI